MEYLVVKGNLNIRRMQDCEADYGLLTKWLGDPAVAAYYEGRTKLYNREMVLEKFGHYVRGEEHVHPCIIELESVPIGYMQYYESEPEELEVFQIREHLHVDKSIFGFDVFLGETAFWNRGIGTQVVQSMAEYLFSIEKARLLVINPQTWNKRAIRCYEKCGFRGLMVLPQYELHDDAWMDCLVMYLGNSLL